LRRIRWGRYLGCRWLVPACYSDEKKNNQHSRNTTIPKEHSTPSWRTPLAAAILWVESVSL
jgi:hypothetical protein